MTTKIKSTTEIDVSLPFFRKKVVSAFKETLSRHVAVLPGDTYVEVYKDGNQYMTISHIHLGKVNHIDVGEIFYKWESIDEDEFLKFHAEALASLSLKPVLMEIPLSVVDDPNDLKEVNI